MERQGGRGDVLGSYRAWAPVGAPLLLNGERDDHWRHFDNSVNAVSFGFVATAILVSMFLVMAIFERFMRPNTEGTEHVVDLESQMGYLPKLAYPSPKITVYANGVSVLMPGDSVPTFIAHPAPVPSHGGGGESDGGAQKRLNSSEYDGCNELENGSRCSTSVEERWMRRTE